MSENIGIDFQCYYCGKTYEFGEGKDFRALILHPGKCRFIHLAPNNRPVFVVIERVSAPFTPTL